MLGCGAAARALAVPLVRYALVCDAPSRQLARDQLRAPKAVRVGDAAGCADAAVGVDVQMRPREAAEERRKADDPARVPATSESKPASLSSSTVA
eukprot:5402392-Prymnesium_polylepis.2